MRYAAITGCFLAIGLLGVSPGGAQEPNAVMIPPRKSGAEIDVFRTFLSIQLMEIHEQLGLFCGCTDPEAGDEESDAGLDSAYAYAREVTDRLIVEAEAAFPGAVAPEELRAYLEARTAGYKSTAEMMADASAVLGKNLHSRTLEAYLMLRRNELYGLSGREPDMEALKQEIRSLGESVRAAEMVGLLVYRRTLWQARKRAEVSQAKAADPAERPSAAEFGR